MKWVIRSNLNMDSIWGRGLKNMITLSMLGTSSCSFFSFPLILVLLSCAYTTSLMMLNMIDHSLGERNMYTICSCILIANWKFIVYNKCIFFKTIIWANANEHYQLIQPSYIWSKGTIRCSITIRLASSRPIESISRCADHSCTHWLLSYAISYLTPTPQRSRNYHACAGMRALCSSGCIREYSLHHVSGPFLRYHGTFYF